jgi:Fic family protein
MLVDLYRTHAPPLTQDMLFAWHRLLLQGRTDLQVGQWRSGSEPMQVVSGPIHTPKVHFEAPPADAVPAEMALFCQWFNDTAPGGPAALPALARAGLAHLYFECIHPFEDGNGRIGRAIAEKALAQGTGQPSLVALSLMIERQRQQYYRELELANKALEADRWLGWFADTVLSAQGHTLRWLEFLIAKARLFDRLRGATWSNWSCWEHYGVPACCAAPGTGWHWTRAGRAATTRPGRDPGSATPAFSLPRRRLEVSRCPASRRSRRVR